MSILGNITHPRGVKVKPSEMADAPFIGLENVEAHTMRLLAVGRAHEVKSSGSYFERGDVLYGRLRPYLNKVHMPKFGGLASGEFIVFPNGRFLDNAYLKNFLNQWEFASFATRLNAGDRPRVDFSQLAEFPFPLAPLPEQHRIVAEIEKQLTRLDAAIAALERVRANLKRYRASVLKTACEGRLVPTEAELARAENRDYEPAGRLLQRVLAERRARWQSQPKRRGKYKEPAPPDTSNLPKLPEGWVWVRLDQITWSLGGGTAVSATRNPSNRRVLRSSAVRPGIINLDDYRFLPPDADERTDAFIATGDLLFTRLSGSLEYVGNCAVVGELHGQTLEFPDRIFRGQCTDSICPHFVQHCFEEKTLRQALQAKAKSTAGHQRISLSDLRSFHLPLPPLTEQHRIVAEVERRLSVVQQAETVVGASLKRAGRLRQSILKQAFSGKLVPQDPNDEPASALLERIRAERAAAETPAKRQRKPRRRRSKPAPARQLGFSQEPP